MSISYQVEGVKKPKLRYRIISIWLKQIIVKYDRIPGDLTYIFCDDEYLKRMNTKYLNHDYYTDIVTFNYNTDQVISGDMFISVDRVRENSVLFGCDLPDELLRVIVHGLLHLLGFNDSNESEKKTIRKIEDDCIFMFKEIRNEYIKGL